jgi:uncharacterized protein YjbJ (UPF0337 family)
MVKDPGKVTKMLGDGVKGVAERAKGTVKEAVGKITGDKELQAEGRAEKAKGSARDAVGAAKDVTKKADK